VKGAGHGRTKFEKRPETSEKVLAFFDHHLKR